MHWRACLAGGTTGLLALFVSCGGSHTDRSPLLIAAASSLRDLLLAVEPEFERTHPGVDLEWSFEASSSHARQIAAGAGFAVFLSADAASLERIGGAVTLRTERPFLGNRLALVGRATSPDERATLLLHPRELTRRTGAIAIGAAAVPVGGYAREWLDSINLTGELETRFVSGRNARATLALVQSGAVEYGFVYRSDALSTGAAQRVVCLWTSAPGDVAIEYVGVALDSAHAIASTDFLEWLSSEAFRNAAMTFGFDPVEHDD